MAAGMPMVAAGRPPMRRREAATVSRATRSRLLRIAIPSAASRLPATWRKPASMLGRSITSARGIAGRSSRRRPKLTSSTRRNPPATRPSHRSNTVPTRAITTAVKPRGRVGAITALTTTPRTGGLHRRFVSSHSVGRRPAFRPLNANPFEQDSRQVASAGVREDHHDRSA